MNARPAPPKVLLAKIGLDGHDRGVRIVARALRDAGMEVVYVGPWASAEQVAAAAVQEDVDLVGISSLAYDHLLVPELADRLRKTGWDGTIVVGGIVQDADLDLLARAGVTDIFPPGQPLQEMVSQVAGLANRREEHA